MVNRLWQHHFGRGLVPTPNDFGRTGQGPTHPALLDHLAAELVGGGWRLKRVHRMILLSNAYRMSSRADRPEALARDEANTWFWRQNPRRAEAEVVRDTILAASGALNPRMGGPGIFPTLPREVHGTQDSAGKGWGNSPPEEQWRRSVYLVVKRALVSPLLECFDFSTTTVPVGVRSTTTVAPQALMLLNDAFLLEQAARLEARLTRETGGDETAWLRRAFALVVQRPPSARELELTSNQLAAQRARLGDAPDAALRARRLVCGALLNLTEVIHID